MNIYKNQKTKFLSSNLLFIKKHFEIVYLHLIINNVTYIGKDNFFVTYIFHILNVLA